MPRIVFDSAGSYFDLADAMVIEIPQDQFDDLVAHDEIEEHLEEAKDIAMLLEDHIQNLNIPQLPYNKDQS